MARRARRPAARARWPVRARGTGSPGDEAAAPPPSRPRARPRWIGWALVVAAACAHWMASPLGPWRRSCWAQSAPEAGHPWAARARGRSWACGSEGSGLQAPGATLSGLRRRQRHHLRGLSALRARVRGAWVRARRVRPSLTSPHAKGRGHPSWPACPHRVRGVAGPAAARPPGLMPRHPRGRGSRQKLQTRARRLGLCRSARGTRRSPPRT
mmetsp:Transcript_9243/g.27340  ORF Transcript_9243/g.27340 Transcript_9243/m.27340 type:complete len:212 (-) Transcript_9243:898-1533(-)